MIVRKTKSAMQLMAMMALLGIALGGLPAARAQTAGASPTAPAAESTGPSAAQTAAQAEENRARYEQVSVLALLAGLQMDEEQIEALLPLLETVREQRRYTVEQAAEHYQDAPATVQAALAAFPGWPVLTPELAEEPYDPAAVQALMLRWEALQAALTQARLQPANGFFALLAPAQRVQVEGRGQAAGRELTQLQLGGAATVQEYLARQMEILPTLSPREYRLLRPWLAPSWTALLRPPQAPGFDYLAGRLLLVMDEVYGAGPWAAAGGPEALAGHLAQFLGLPAAAQAPYFEYSRVELLVDSEHALGVAQRRLGQVPAGPLGYEPGVRDSAEVLRRAALRGRLRQFLESLGLSAGQLAALRDLVAQAQGRLAAAETAQATALTAWAPELRQMRETLLEGGGPPAQQVQRWNDLQDRLRRERREARLEALARLADFQEVLTLDQAELVQWPPLALAGVQGRAEQVRELRLVAAELERGASLLADLRFQRMIVYRRIRVSRTQEFVSFYVPRESPAWQPAYEFALEMVTRARTTPPEEWEAVWPLLATELMIGLGAAPSPLPQPEVPRRWAWEQVQELLTSDQAPVLLNWLTGSG